MKTHLNFPSPADEERREREAEQHAAVYEVLGQQVKEQERKTKEQSAQEVAFARKQAEDVSKWRQQEDQKRTYQKEAMLRLKVLLCTVYSQDFD